MAELDVSIQNSITADGTYDFDQVGHKTTVNVSGSFGGGSMVFSTINPLKTAEGGEHEGSPFTSGFVGSVNDTTRGGRLRLVLTGATSPTITVHVS